MVHTDTAALSRYGMAFWMLCGCAVPVPGSAADGVRIPPAADMQTGIPSSAMNEDLLEFDIPAQELDAALRQYATLTRQATLFRSEIVSGRMSSAVRGRYSPKAGLNLLLAGTGLMAEKVDAGPDAAFILKADSTAAASAADSAGAAAGVVTTVTVVTYPALIQAGVWAALCANDAARPGTYRSLMRFQVDAAGQIRQPRLLGSTGSRRRDAAVLATLQQVRLDRAPPPDLPQPVTLLILPRDASHPDAAPHCRNDDGNPSGARLS